MPKRRALLLFLTVAAFTCVGCGSSDKSATPASEASTPPTHAEAGACVPISEKAKATLELPVAGATKAPADVRGMPRWYYSTTDGATWVSGVDPATGEADAPTLPLNDKARSSSDVGADVPRAAPAFGEATDTDTSAVQSRRCANES